LRALLGGGAHRAAQAGFVVSHGGELGRDENPATQRFAQSLDPHYLVDRRSDDREVKAIHRANIAINHLAEMEREIDRGNRLSHPRSIRVKSVEAALCIGGGRKRVVTGFMARRCDEGKACEHAFAGVKELPRRQFSDAHTHNA
jgi:hypothetical protein